MPVIILPINPTSDGDGLRTPKTEGHTRNDDYWLHRLGDAWAKDLNRPSPAGTSYRLDRLPDGYGGYEKGRGDDSKHVDRYLYGHARGPARSLPDFLPHFLFLMGGGGGSCGCKLCRGGRRVSGANLGDERGSARSGSPVQRSPFFAQPRVPPPKGIRRPKKAPGTFVQRQHSDDMAPPMRGKQVDEEGTPDALRLLLDKLKAAGTEGKVDEPIVENMSPDWRTDHVMLMKTFKEWSKLPKYVPRVGELVLFVRHLGLNETLGWDKSAQTWRVVGVSTRSWVDKPKWEVGVITQMPTEAVSDADLDSVPANKKHGVVEAGFRIEPLPQPNSVNKSLTRQHKYMPLHAIRPLALWKECLSGSSEPDWHPTVRHALTVASSFCVLGKYYFKGTWPEATIFAQGVYIGPELVTVGDAVRLQNRSGDHKDTVVTDVMIITAIKVRVVNLDEASDDDYDDRHPYNTCTHISGHVYTQDPARSFDGIGKRPIPKVWPLLSGIWYYVTDPKKPAARIEAPFQRIIGRCYEDAALKAWFTPPSDIAAPRTFQAVNTKPTIKLNHKTLSSASATATDVSRSLPGILEARAYSQKHDVRIDRDAGKSWFWADSRVQQLDLHEVNGRFVGPRDERRGQGMGEWRRALKALDWGRGGVEEYYAARREREEAVAGVGRGLGASASGMVAVGALGVAADAAAAGKGLRGSTEAEKSSLDDEEEEDEEGQGAMDVDQQPTTSLAAGDVVQIDDDDEGEDEDAGAALAAFKKTTSAAAGAGKGGGEVVEIDSDEEMGE